MASPMNDVLAALASMTDAELAALTEASIAAFVEGEGLPEPVQARQIIRVPQRQSPAPG